ncbi:MAG: hypothetical protein U9N49_10170 [Campylobacterota bacterium]|nr:hypothetical protein [Campylobacterota bacterium]
MNKNEVKSFDDLILFCEEEGHGVKFHHDENTLSINGWTNLHDIASRRSMTQFFYNFLENFAIRNNYIFSCERLGLVVLIHKVDPNLTTKCPHCGKELR